MFGSGVLDTAIGVVFMFLLVSMLVTITNELIAAALLSRAKWLRAGIDRLLDPAWAVRLYDHPLIESSGASAPTNSRWRGSGPSYIPSRSFANVLLGLVREGAQPGDSLRDCIGRIKNNADLQKTLLLLYDDAEGDVEHFKQNIEIWFNHAMDRVGGWYKRRSQWVVAALSVLAAVSMNVDTLLVIQHLDTQPGARDALVAEAKAYADRPDRPDQDPHFVQVNQELQKLDMPIGWVGSRANDRELTNYQQLPWLSAQGGRIWLDTLGFHWLGWLLTALAASLGAPFWFDMLNRAVSIRSAGKAPEDMPKPPRSVPLPLEPGESPAEAEAARAAKPDGKTPTPPAAQP